MDIKIDIIPDKTGYDHFGITEQEIMAYYKQIVSFIQQNPQFEQLTLSEVLVLLLENNIIDGRMILALAAQGLYVAFFENAEEDLDADDDENKVINFPIV